MKPYFIRDIKINPPITLAPMEGVTNIIFRRLIRQIGGTGLTCTEFIPSSALSNRGKKVLRLAEFDPEERPISIQIYGKDPMEMAESARVLQDLGASIVDINMGCPSKQVCANSGGSALMREPELALDIVRAVRKAITIPMTVKMRSGFDHTNKKYDMLYLNKFPRQHRLKLFNKIKDTNLLDNSLYSFIRLEEPIRLPSEYELPWIDAKAYPLIGSDQDLYEKPYNDTKFSLISETNDTNKEVFITEKIWKCIIAKHIFVVHGNLHYLKTLKELGFKTFSDLIDESYDVEPDKDKRIEKIVEVCKKLNQKDWKLFYAKTREIRQYNYDTFFNKAQLL